MKTKTKALVLFLCAVLLVVTSVYVTMAFLTSEDSVKNTFTVGKVAISIDESDVDSDGTVVNGSDRVEANEYHLIPGHFYVKDPIVHVADGSEDCWLFVKLNNGLKDIIAPETIETQIAENGWTLINADNNIWAYNEVVSENENIPVFESFTLTDDADISSYATIKDAEGNIIGGKTIDIIAYAVQYDGFESGAADAWTATFGANN